jgi:hypothetical protein
MAKKSKRSAKSDSVEVKAERAEAVSTEDIVAAYQDVANGTTGPVGKMEDVAAKVGMKKDSLSTRIQMIKKTLREEGASDEELKLIFPPLKRATQNRETVRGILEQFRNREVEAD